MFDDNYNRGYIPLPWFIRRVDPRTQTFEYRFVLPRFIKAALGAAVIFWAVLFAFNHIQWIKITNYQTVAIHTLVVFGIIAVISRPILPRLQWPGYYLTYPGLSTVAVIIAGLVLIGYFYGLPRLGLQVPIELLKYNQHPGYIFAQGVLIPAVIISYALTAETMNIQGRHLAGNREVIRS